jgi:hypothetical protein
MKLSLDATLEEKVSELESKSERIESANNLESKISSTTSLIYQLNQKFASLEATADKLSFYVGVLETVFEEERPPDVEQAIDRAHRRANISEEAVLESAEKQNFSELYDAVDSADEDLSEAIDRIDQIITDEFQSPIENELSSAKELNRIIGGSDDGFQDIISSIEVFLNQSIWNPENSPNTLASQWKRLRTRWEENSGKHGWDPFQAEHDLSDDTIDELKQFTEKDSVRLADLSLPTLKEIKRVPELESALQVELKS